MSLTDRLAQKEQEKASRFYTQIESETFSQYPNLPWLERQQKATLAVQAARKIRKSQVQPW